MYPVDLVGDSVILREFRSTDIESVLRIVGDDRVTSWLSFASRDRTQTEVMVRNIMERARDRNRTEYYLAIEAKRELVGFVRLGMSGTQAAKIGYSVHADHWGRGYASEATRLIVDFGFSVLELHRISAAIGPTNLASVAVVKRLGFSYEGRIRDHVFTNDEWRDSLLYSILVDEWPTPSRGANVTVVPTDEQ